MKRMMLSAIACLVLAGAVLSAADKPEKKDAKKPETPAATRPAKPVNEFCAVEKDNPVDSTVPTFTYKGKVIGFCCEDCVPKFKKDPEFYMKGLK